MYRRNHKLIQPFFSTRGACVSEIIIIVDTSDVDKKFVSLL